MSDSNIPFTSALNCSAISSEGDSDQGTSLSRNNDAISLYHLLNIHTSATTCRCDELRLCVLVLDCVCACPLHDDHEDCGSPGQLRSALGLSCRRDDGTKRSRSRPCFLDLWWVVVFLVGVRCPPLLPRALSSIECENRGVGSEVERSDRPLPLETTFELVLREKHLARITFAWNIVNDLVVGTDAVQ